MLTVIRVAIAVACLGSMISCARMKQHNKRGAVHSSKDNAELAGNVSDPEDEWTEIILKGTQVVISGISTGSDGTYYCSDHVLLQGELGGDLSFKDSVPLLKREPDNNRYLLLGPAWFTAGAEQYIIYQDYGSITVPTKAYSAKGDPSSWINKGFRNKSKKGAVHGISM
eukprot:gnl/MRDRNA2_/MRDRNA2_32844_c0_seq1.p1 gnl/MRDRNA2_/MRDRNA2_32844_c0~~gnl/MRDRNA2_/MRDRNA2_32844_c0_seq1.p1  ORF type:complete len:169 (-),score=23.33 gnl/MRDRNA2_/MRDRNA2_32844_c0_seq1:42-548(-)